MTAHDLVTYTKRGQVLSWRQIFSLESKKFTQEMALESSEINNKRIWIYKGINERNFKLQAKII